jgi:hypothetical protein
MRRCYRAARSARTATLEATRAPEAISPAYGVFEVFATAVPSTRLPAQVASNRVLRRIN